MTANFSCGTLSGLPTTGAGVAEPQAAAAKMASARANLIQLSTRGAGGMVTALRQTRLVATLTGKAFEQRRQPLASTRKEIQEMDARATVSGSLSSTRILGFFVSALLVAVLIGGAGGYLVRAVTYTVTTTMSPASVP